jgi:hypothetical protein
VFTTKKNVQNERRAKEDACLSRIKEGKFGLGDLKLQLELIGFEEDFGIMCVCVCVFCVCLCVCVCVCECACGSKEH